MELILIRHAESEHNRDRTVIGGRSLWCELSPRGKQQAIALGQALASRGERFDRVISSTAVRAQQTARWMLEQLEDFHLYNLEFSGETVELDMGDFTGRLRAKTYTPEIISAIHADTWGYIHPGGESQRMAAERMIAFVEGELLPSCAEGQRVALVSHGLSIRCFLTELLGWDIAGVLDVPVENTSITRLKYSANKGWELIKLNDTTHLQDAGIGRLDGVVRPTVVETPEAT